MFYFLVVSSIWKKTQQMQLVTLQEIQSATEKIYATPYVKKTPCLSHVQQFCQVETEFNLSLKLESLQTQGSFKTR